MGMGTEAQKLVWEGAIPLQIHLHESEVTTLPPPPPALVLAPRIGYLPLLIPLIKPHFNCTLPPGVDTVWFDYKGLPLKWSTPTGVLFDLLCAEPERPWNLTVHFRGYPTDILIPCDGEDSVKWSFINSLKEAAYIINGNCKNIMNMSQSDQLELWRCIVKGNMEGYLRISSKLKLGKFSDEFSSRPQKNIGESEAGVGSRIGRVPVRLFVRKISENHGDLEDASVINSWDELSFINQAIELRRDGGGYFMLHDAVRSLIPDLFEDEPSIDDEIPKMERVDVSGIEKADSSLNGEDLEHPSCTGSEASEEAPDKQKLQSSPKKTLIKVIRVQGIEPRWDIPFSWVVNNLMNPDFFLHICVFIAASMNETEETT